MPSLTNTSSNEAYRRAVVQYEAEMRRLANEQVEAVTVDPREFTVRPNSIWPVNFTNFVNDEYYALGSNTETVKESGFDWPAEDRLMAMKMVIRSKLLKYFKDIRQEKVATAPVGLHDANSYYSGRSTQYQYQRRERQLHQEQLLIVDTLYLAHVELEPHTITLFDNQLSKSKELESIGKDIEAFMKRFLPGVKVLHHEGKQAPEGAIFSIDTVPEKDFLKEAYPLVNAPPIEEQIHECNDPDCPLTGDPTEDMPF